MRLSARTFLVALLLSGPAASLTAQQPAGVPVSVDPGGVMRWTDSGDEVALFGVNYTTPFAYAYRAHGYLGVSHKEAIERDVAHLARLGVEAYRIHVWDREISDQTGNLVANDHLDLLDYLIAELQERGITIVLTPIFWGGPGYPERNPVTDGFSEDYSKGEMTVSPEARRAQQRYLSQFVEHVNPYTGLSYRDDPAIIAIELFNEPSHPAPPEEQTRYIDDLARAVRATGYRKPIFYNISIGWSEAHARAVCSAEIQGVTFQWYPSGLVRGSTVRTNMLPNVDAYPIPFIDIPECRDKARLVYEFDAADIMGSYMYPAMARSFRGAGMQWATQFAYDPLAIAHVNTEYQTHYLNLVYTPSKAISFLIAGEAFRRVPRNESYGSYPESSSFGPFRLSYEQDLSEMVTEEAFYYSNSTDRLPPNPGALRKVAGYGDSPVVQYEGRGAYFLDRLDEGVWRLEVYPDAIEINDAFGRSSFNREVTRLVWREWPMEIRLPDLGKDYTVQPVNAGNDHSPSVSSGAFGVRPGVYVLRWRGVMGGRWVDPEESVGRLRLGEFHAPAPSDTSTVVVHHPALEVSEGEPLVVRADLVAQTAPERVELWARVGGGREFTRLPMARVRAFTYEATVPPALVGDGSVEYAVRVGEGERAHIFPGGRRGGVPGDTVWRVSVADAGSPVVLFDAQRDAQRILHPHPYRYVRFRSETVAGSAPGRRALRAEIESFEPDPHHYAVRAFLGEEGRPGLRDLDGYDVLKVSGRSTGDAGARVEVALVEVDGTVWGAVVPLSPEWQEVSVPVSSLRPTTLALLPRPYPEFLPNELATNADMTGSLELSKVEGVQIRIGAELYDPASLTGPLGFEVERVTLVRGATGALP